jgi:hypothetical protein
VAWKGVTHHEKNEVINMNVKVIGIILVAILAIVAGIQVGAYVAQPDVYDPLENNTAAQEIEALGIDCVVEDLGEDANGYIVRGQVTFAVYENGTQVPIKVALDDDIDPNSYEAHAVLYHELGHLVHNGGTEEQADNYAATRGYIIQDAYHGIH